MATITSQHSARTFSLPTWSVSPSVAANILPILETCAHHLRELTIDHTSPLRHLSPEQAIQLPQLRRISLREVKADSPLKELIRTPKLEYAELSNASTYERDTLAMLNSVV